MLLCLLPTALLLGTVPASIDSQKPAAAPPTARLSLLAGPTNGATAVQGRAAPVPSPDPTAGTHLRSLADPFLAESAGLGAPSGLGVRAATEGGGHSLGTCACTGAPAEGEAGCGLPTDNFNGGCNFMPHVYSHLTLGQSVCGTAAYDGSFRDTDWYQFTLTTTTTVEWTVRAQFSPDVWLFDNNCPPTVLAFNTGPACTDIVTTATLSPGTYVAWAGPDFGNPVITCGVNDDYHGTLLGVTACGYDDGVSNGHIGLGSFGGGEELYLHRMGGPGEFARVSSISMAWGTPVSPGQSVPNGTPATIRIFKDPNDDGFPNDLVQLKSKNFFTTGVDTDFLQTIAFDAPVDVSGFYFIGVSLSSGNLQYPLAWDNNNPSNNRAWFVGETVGSGGAINYGNLPSNDFFGENAALGIDGVYLLRAACEPLEGGCRLDDGFAETECGLGGTGGENLYLDVFGAPGEVATVTSVAMSWGSTNLPGFSIPNGTGAQIRIFEDPNDDGIPNDAVLLQTQGLLTQDVDTGIFHATTFSPPVVVRGVYFVGVSIVCSPGQYPIGYDTTTPANNHSWWIAQPSGALNYSNLASAGIFGPNPASVGLDGVHMLRADCHPEDEITPFCAPGVGGIVTCPCGNPQIPAGATKGCNNFAGGGTGGAILAGSGAATISTDTVAMNVTAGVASNVTVLFQGTTNTANSRTGAGVKCVGGTLKRLYKGNQAAGAIAFPNNATPFHLQSIAKGFTIMPPVTLYYYAAYRNSAANGHPGCPGLNFGFNSTNALAVIWTP